MANYVYIEEGEILEYHDALPRNWKNTSGFNLLADDVPALIALGWYPVINESAVYDPEVSYISGYTYEIETEQVRQIPTIVDFTEEELNRRKEEDKQNFFRYLRDERGRRLERCDWTQLTDIQLVKDETWVETWRVYRQSLRDLPEVYEDTENFDIDSISWPIEPEN
jgi:gamma-glutamylcyclotransferase (GGCT)/AIG2-like uncharacterized protein YtfP